MTEAFVYEALRTPRGRVRRDGGTLAQFPAYELLAQLLREYRDRGVPVEAVQDVVMGVSTTYGEQAAEEYVARTSGFVPRPPRRRAVGSGS